jgi:hypothetical protein
VRGLTAHHSLLALLTTRLTSAFGHPLGCTGARQIVTVMSELRRSKQKIAVTSMCVGTVSGPLLPCMLIDLCLTTPPREWAWPVS